MNRRYFRYVVFHYAKNFLILLLGLSLAVVLIDFLQHASKLHGGINQKVLYMYYTWEEMLALIYPLVILFALAWTQINFINRNIFVAFFSFGYSRREMFRPFFFSALAIYLFFSVLQMTDFAYGRDNAKAILNHDENRLRVNDLFFKYNDSFVFVKQLDPLEKLLKDVMIFKIGNHRVVRIISFPSAAYKEGCWVAKRVVIRNKRYDEKGEMTGFRTEKKDHMKLLEEYRPQVIRQIYQGKALTLKDGLQAWRLLHRQGLDTNKVKATIYNKIIMPVFSLALLTVIFFRTPPYRRFIRKERIWVYSLGSTMLVWALLFALYRLGINGVVDPDFGQLVPIFVMVAYAGILYRKERLGGVTT